MSACEASQGGVGELQVRRTTTVLSIALFALSCVLALFSLTQGYVPLSLDAVLAGAFGLADEKTNLIVQDLRAPRMVLA